VSGAGAAARQGAECDIVMNGGWAGALIHPAAVVELARKYSFRGIGGSAIGAFCAAATAAAELGRTSKGGGFNRLKSVLEWIATQEPGHADINLFELLKPDRTTRPYYHCLRAGLNKNLPGAAAAIGVEGVRRFPFLGALAALPGVLLGISAFFAGTLWLTLLWLVAGLIVFLTLPPLAALLKVVIGAGKAVRKNSFGICSGTSDLTPWIISTLDTLAGKAEKDDLLTFGDLWGTTDPTQERRIDLRLTASDLSLGLPVRLPFEDQPQPRVDEIYYFREEELARYFPAAVVKALVRKSRQNQYYRRVSGYLPLPEPADIPVAFAVRLAVGMPLLMSAVPLYRARRVRVRNKLRWQMKRCWITGGGVTGSQHIHTFDDPLPTRPTFSIHLAPVVREGDDRLEWKKGIWVQNLIDQQGPILWQGFDNWKGFMRAAAYVSRNWQSNAMLQTPGFKERMAVVKIAPAHTGLYPRFDREAVSDLMRLGAHAAGQLIERFAVGKTSQRHVSWDAHRWIRFRSTMARIEKFLVKLRNAYYHEPGDGESTYDHLMMRGQDEPPDAFRWIDKAQRNHALRVTNQLLTTIERWQSDKFTFACGELPQPEGMLRIQPKY
jgi:hypothetical protein